MVTQRTSPGGWVPSLLSLRRAQYHYQDDSTFKDNSWEVDKKQFTFFYFDLGNDIWYPLQFSRADTSSRPFPFEISLSPSNLLWLGGWLLTRERVSFEKPVKIQKGAINRWGNATVKLLYRFGCRCFWVGVGAISLMAPSGRFYHIAIYYQPDGHMVASF